MPALEYPNVDAHNTRRLARKFTPTVPNHHPFLDPGFQGEDEDLVPADLAPRGKLNWKLPRKATTNLHIMLKLTNKADELLDEWRDKIPQIDEVVSEWSEMKGASPTTLGELQQQAQAMFNNNCKDAQDEADLAGNDSSDGYIFNMVKNLDSPGRGDVIYLTNGVEDDKFDGKKGIIPKNLRSVEWLDFDGSHVHLTDAINQPQPLCAAVDRQEQGAKLGESSTLRRTSIPQNLRTTDWELDGILSPTVYSPTAASDVCDSYNQVRPFDEFWRSHINEPDFPEISPLQINHPEWRPLNPRSGEYRPYCER